MQSAQEVYVENKRVIVSIEGGVYSLRVFRPRCYYKIELYFFTSLWEDILLVAHIVDTLTFAIDSKYQKDFEDGYLYGELIKRAEIFLARYEFLEEDFDIDKIKKSIDKYIFYDIANCYLFHHEKIQHGLYEFVYRCIKNHFPHNKSTIYRRIEKLRRDKPPDEYIENSLLKCNLG